MIPGVQDLAYRIANFGLPDYWLRPLLPPMPFENPIARICDRIAMQCRYQIATYPMPMFIASCVA